MRQSNNRARFRRSFQFMAPGCRMSTAHSMLILIFRKSMALYVYDDGRVRFRVLRRLTCRLMLSRTHKTLQL